MNLMINSGITIGAFYLLVIGSFRPAIFYLAYLGLSPYYSGIISFCLSLILGIFLFFKREKISVSLDLFFIIPIIFFLVYYSILEISFFQRSFINTIFSYLRGFILIIFVINFFNIKTFLEKIIKTHIVIGAVCSLGVVLAFLGVLPLWKIFENTDGVITGHFILVYSKEYFPLGSGYFTRVSGIFDEPGTHSVITIFLILLNKKYLKNDKLEIGLILSSIMTFSLAFFVIISIYYLINMKRLKNSFVILLLFLPLIYGSIKLKDSEIYGDIYKKTIGRVIDMHEGIENTSRRKTVMQVNYLKNNAWFNPYWGYPKAFLSEKLGDSFDRASFFALLIEYGYVGTIIYYFPFIWAFLRSLLKWNKDESLACLLLGVNFLQRPDYLFVPYMILFYLLFFYHSKSGKGINHVQANKIMLYRSDVL